MTGASRKRARRTGVDRPATIADLNGLRLSFVNAIRALVPGSETRAAAAVVPTPPADRPAAPHTLPTHVDVEKISGAIRAAVEEQLRCQNEFNAQAWERLSKELRALRGRLDAIETNAPSDELRSQLAELGYDNPGVALPLT